MLNCVGFHLTGFTPYIPPIQSFASYWMNNNAVATNIVTQGVHVPIAGTTTPGEYCTVCFTVGTDNRITYNGPSGRVVQLTMTASVYDGAAQKQIQLAFEINGTDVPGSLTLTTTNSAGRADNLVSIGVIALNTGDVIRACLANLTDTNDLTCENLTVVVKRVD